MYITSICDYKTIYRQKHDEIMNYFSNSKIIFVDLYVCIRNVFLSNYRSLYNTVWTDLTTIPACLQGNHCGGDWPTLQGCTGSKLNLSNGV